MHGMSGTGRYSRSMLFPGSGTRGRSGSRSFSIAFVGVGAVGAAAAESAARAGVGRDHARGPRRRRGIEPRAPVPLRRGGRRAGSRPRPRPRRRGSREIDPASTVRGRRRGSRSRQRARDPRRPRPRLRRLGQLRDAAPRLRRGARSRAASRSTRPASARRASSPRSCRERRPACAAISRPCRRPGSGPTCDTVGRRADAAARSWPPIGMTEALRLAVGQAAPRAALLRSRSGMEDSSRAGCFESAPAVGRVPRSARDGGFPPSRGKGASDVVKLCGRNSVQVSPAGRERPGLRRRSRRGCSRVGRVRRSAHLLSARRRGRQPDDLSPTGAASSAARTTRGAPARSTIGTSGGERLRRIRDRRRSSPPRSEVANLAALLRRGRRGGDPDRDLLRARPRTRRAPRPMRRIFATKGRDGRQAAAGALRRAGPDLERLGVERSDRIARPRTSRSGPRR